MRGFLIAIALALVAGACGGDSTESAPSTTQAATTTTVTSAASTTTTTTLTTTTSQPERLVVVISDVRFGSDGYVALTNHGETDASMGGWQLCQRPAYFTVPDITILSGETVFFTLGDSTGLDGRVFEMIDSHVGLLRAVHGEMGLYTRAPFDDSDAIINYVEWGTVGHPRSPVAIEANIWKEGAVVVADDSAGIAKTTTEPVSANDWVAYASTS